MRFWTVLLLAGTALGHPQLQNFRRANGTSTPSYVSNSNSTSNSSTSVADVLPTPVSTDGVATASASFSGDYEFPTSRFGAIPTLMPVIPDTVDVNKVENLTPVKPGSGEPLHYLQESQSGGAGLFAIATPNWKFPSVVLDHSAAISSVQFSTSGNLVIVFANKAAFDHGATNWNAKDGLIFITYTPGCGDFDKNERCYYEANAINFNGNSLSAIANGAPQSIHDATNNIQLQWGDYNNQAVNYASGAPTPSGTSSQSSGSGTTGSDSPSTSLPTTPTTRPKCTAPVDNKYNLPTACLGYHFDDDLDSGLGYFNLSHFDFAQLIEDIGLNYDDDTDLSVSLDKRGIKDDIKAGLDRAGKAVVKVANDAKQKADRAAEDLAKKFKAKTQQLQNAANNLAAQAKKDLDQLYNKYKSTVDEIKGDIQTLMKFLQGTPIKIPFDETPRDITLPRPSKDCEGSGNAKRATSSKATPRKTKASDQKKEKKEKKDACHPKEGAKGVESPWGGKAVLIKSFGNTPTEKELRPSGSRKQTLLTRGKFLNIYCVDCGLTGSLTTKGFIKFDTRNGITEGKVEGDIPNLSVGAGIGIFGAWEEKHEYKQNLYDIPISPFTLGFATIGPIISVGTSFKVGGKLEGNIHARADIKFEKMKFSYDFASKKFDKSGFVPTEIVPKLDVEGQLSLTAGFGIPVALELALTVGPCSFCKGSVGIETMPTLEANASIAAQANYNFKTKTGDYGLKPIDGCKGISAVITARNYVNFVGHTFKILKDLALPIHVSPSLKIKNFCIDLSKKETPKRQVPTISASANSTNNGTEVLFDLTPFVVNTVDDLGFVEHFNPSVPLNIGQDGDYWYSTISLQGSDGAYFFSSCNDGNVYMQTNETYYDLDFYETCTTLWAGSDEIVLSAPSGAVLHYYNNTMSKTGVSRLRVSQEDELPDTAVYVALAPFTYNPTDNSPPMLAAIDPYDNLFFPVVCTYTNTSQGAKIYLVDSDVEAGIAMLKSPDISYSITNGEVKDCQVLFLELTDRTEGAWSDYDDDTDSIYENDPLELEFDESFLIDGNIDESKLGKVPEETDFEFDDPLGEDWLDDDLVNDDAEETV